MFLVPHFVNKNAMKLAKYEIQTKAGPFTEALLFGEVWIGLENALFREKLKVQ